MTPKEANWKCGNEFAPYHPQASHVDPAYRDGWNHCYRAFLATQEAEPAAPTAQPHTFGSIMHTALEAIASMPIPEQDNLLSASMRNVAQAALKCRPAAPVEPADHQEHLMALRSLRSIGRQMANILFNWSQEANSVGGTLSPASRDLLRRLQTDWDQAARSAYLLPASPLLKAEGADPLVDQAERPTKLSDAADDDSGKKIVQERDIAIAMLAEWCVAVDVNGTGWDDWNEHYKDAAYRPGPLRELLDKAIAEACALRGEA